MWFCRERPDFLQFGLQALDDTSDPRQEAARESEKEVNFKIPSILPRILGRFLPMLDILDIGNIIIHCRL